MIQPIGKKILIKVAPIQEKSTGGIIITQAKIGKRPQIGEIVAIGNDVVDFKIGDKIAFNKGNFLLIDEKYVDNLPDHAIIEEKEIIGIFEY